MSNRRCPMSQPRLPTYTLVEIDRRWAGSHVDLQIIECPILGEQVLVARYPDMVSNAGASLRRVPDFMDEPYRDASVRFVTDKAPINSSFAGETSELSDQSWAAKSGV